MPGKCIFKIDWLEKEIYKNWLAPCGDRYKAKCKLCSKLLDLSNMGESALKAHMTGKKHKAAVEASKTKFLFSNFKENQSSPQCTETSDGQVTSDAPKVISDFLQKTDVQNAEIMWALKCVNSHYSYNSCSKISNLFSAMFPDSQIAAQFSCGEKKMAYICSFGIAPYFKKILLKCVNEAEYYTVLFDETLNKTKQEKQMDILVRFWHSDLNEVSTRYLTSVFMGHSKANDILSAFYECTADQLQFQKILQISMDGPAVNWAFYDMLQDDVKKKYGCEILNIGTCGLHILNNAFKCGELETDWDISSVLSSFYYLFKDSPARRDDFFKLSKLKKFPLKFTSHRWLENVPCAERALEIWKDMLLYIENVTKGIIKMQKPPKSYYIAQKSIKDVLMPSKIAFFLSVAKILYPVLTLYQNDKPLLPFLATDIFKLFKQCLSTFNVIKAETVSNLSICRICKFDFQKDLTSITDISAGFVADKLMRELKFQKKVQEKDVLTFKSECRKFIFALLRKIIQNSPLNYAIVRHLVCLDPRVMVDNEGICITKMQKILEKLSECKKIDHDACETVLFQFRSFLNTEVKMNSTDFAGYDVQKMRLDTFLMKYISKKEYSELHRIIKNILILSHGQAAVERGFSVNKNIETINMNVNTYISKKIIYDHILFCGGIENVGINKELRDSVSSARQLYLRYLEDQRLLKENCAKGEKRKFVEEELNSLNLKLQKTEKDINERETVADNLAAEAEVLKDIQRFIKSNNFRKQIKEKKEELVKIKRDIEIKKKELKNL